MKCEVETQTWPARKRTLYGRLCVSVCCCCCCCWYNCGDRQLKLEDAVQFNLQYISGNSTALAHRRALPILHTRRGRSRGGGCRWRCLIENKTKNGWVVAGVPNHQIYLSSRRRNFVRSLHKTNFWTKKIIGEGSHPPPKFMLSPKHRAKNEILTYRENPISIHDCRAVSLRLDWLIVTN